MIPQHAGRLQLMHSRCSPIPAFRSICTQSALPPFCSIRTCPHITREALQLMITLGRRVEFPLIHLPGYKFQLFHNYPHPHVPIITAYLLTFIPQLSYPSFTIFRTRRWVYYWIYLNRRLLFSFGNDGGTLSDSTKKRGPVG